MTTKQARQPATRKRLTNILASVEKRARTFLKEAIFYIRLMKKFSLTNIKQAMQAALQRQRITILVNVVKRARNSLKKVKKSLTIWRMGVVLYVEKLNRKVWLIR